jgi:hypothetical protein
MHLSTEYLIIIEKEASPPFYDLCEDIEDFNRLLKSDPDIAVESNLIIYKGKSMFGYWVKSGKIADKDQRFFHIKLTFEGEDEDIENYAELLKAIRIIVYRSGGQPETLWDDVSFYYSNKAYPLIYKIENLMRKLITYFMLTNVGKEWVTEASPTSFRDAIDKSKRKQYVDVLHQIDFIHLGDFLFKPYQTRNVSELYEKLDSAQKLEDLMLSELKEFQAKSNWDRYFSKVVDCSNEYLNKRWNQLYELRCMVAHNAIIGKTEYGRIEQLIGEVGEYLQKAIDNLDKVHVPTEDKEQLAENVASNISKLSGEFIQLWKTFIALQEKTLLDLRLPSTVPPMRALQTLADNDFLDDDLLNEAKELTNFRNALVHDVRAAFTEQEIISYINRLEAFVKAFRQSWKDEVINALSSLGGKASLPEIYEYIEKNTSRKLPDKWKSSVRKTLQIYSSDTESYKQGRDDLFRHLDKGYWGLRNQKSDASNIPP